MSECKQFPDSVPEFTQQFIDAVQSVNEYNGRYTGLAGTMRGLFDMLIQVEDEDMPDHTSEQDQAEMSKELVTLLQDEELATMGIKLFDADAPGVRAYVRPEAREGVTTSSSLTMLVGDAELFKATVSQLSPTEEQKPLTDKSVNTVLSTSAKLVYEAYSNDFDGDETLQQHARYIAEDQLSMFTDLSPTLALAGFSDLDSYNSLSEYLARQQSGTLGDYIGADRLNLLAGTENFGPSRWQTDSTAEMLMGRWTKALDYLKGLRDRPQPSPFYSELFAKLRPEFDEARDWIATQSKEDLFFWKQRVVIEEIRLRWEQEFQLENNFYLDDRAAEGYTPVIFDPNEEEPTKPVRPKTPRIFGLLNDPESKL